MMADDRVGARGIVRRFVPVGLPLLLLCAAGAPGRAAERRPEPTTIHALVMGFDGYRFKQSLDGSRNDAADLAEVLKRHGVSDIAVLTAPSTTRADVEQAWAAMAARAGPGDLLFVSFSGHGNREPEKGEPKHTPDGFDKGFLLPLFDEDTHPEEQLRDEHLYDLFKVASDDKRQILFVADACHSGATVRAVKASTAVMRFQRFETHGQPFPPPPPPAAVVHRPPIAGLTVFSAADESQTIQEFTIDGERRGALSYVLARGLDGAAAEPNGHLTAGALARYVLTNVRLRSENTQIPSATTPNPDLSIFATGAPPARAGLPDLAPIALYAEEMPAALSGVQPAATARDATLSWTGDIVRDAHGDVVATGITPNALQATVDARRVLDALARTMGQGGHALGSNVAALGQGASDRFYLQGETVRIEAEQGDLHFLTVFDLSADGTVQFLWPRRGDPLAWTEASSPHFDVRVQRPFGQDTLVFVESDQALPDLHAALRALDGQVTPVALYEALRLWLPQVRFELGIHPLFTCAALQKDGTCA